MRTALALLAALGLAAPAVAQEDDDAIGSILMRGTNHPADALGAAEPQDAPPPIITPPSPPAPQVAVNAPPPNPPASIRPPAPAWTPPASPSSALAARPSQPASLQNPGAPPDGSPSPRDLLYEGRVRTTFSSAQGAQGPMDGGWVLVSEHAERLYALQIVDRGDGFGLEGAWRDLRRPQGALGAVGLIDSIGVDSGGLSIRFAPRAGGEAVSASLVLTSDGRWVGEVTGLEHGRVTLRRP